MHEGKLTSSASMLSCIPRRWFDASQSVSCWFNRFGGAASISGWTNALQLQAANLLAAASAVEVYCTFQLYTKPVGSYVCTVHAVPGTSICTVFV
jgi:hypothetical protein